MKERLIRLIAEALRTSSLLELAEKRKNAINDIRSYQPVIAEHILKLYLFQHSKNQIHWIKEVDGWLSKINRIKLKQGKISFKDYLEILWEGPFETLDEVKDRVKYIYEDYPQYNPSRYYNNENKQDIKKLYSNLKTTYTQLSQDLVNNNLQSIKTYIKYD